MPVKISESANPLQGKVGLTKLDKSSNDGVEISNHALETCLATRILASTEKELPRGAHTGFVFDAGCCSNYALVWIGRVKDAKHDATPRPM